MCKPSIGRNHIEQNCVVYSIPCGTCEKVYIGETHRGLETRLKEHRSDIRLGKCNTGLSEQIVPQNQVVDWPRATSHGTQSRPRQTYKRKAVESAYIATRDTLNLNIGSTEISKYAALTALGQ